MRQIMMVTMLCSAVVSQAGVLDMQLKRLGVSQRDISIYIDKSAHSLELRAGKVTLKKYSCVFGRNAVDDKMRQGDKCTPEGVFHIKAKYPHRSWDKFMWIDYPTAASWKKYEANRRKGLIRANADIGGEIGIHGVPQGYEYMINKKINWTDGCISLSNADVDEIYEYVGAGTEVVIVK